MESEHKVNIGEDILVGIIVGAWLVLTLVILGQFGIHDGWPAFLVLLMFFESGAKIENLQTIFVGATVGLLLATGMHPAIALLVPLLGTKAAIMLVVFFIVFLILAMGNVAHMLFNNYTFLYYTIASMSVFHKPLLSEWLIVLFLAGAFFVGGIMVIAKKFHLAGM